MTTYESIVAARLSDRSATARMLRCQAEQWSDETLEAVLTEIDNFRGELDVIALSLAAVAHHAEQLEDDAQHELTIALTAVNVQHDLLQERAANFRVVADRRRAADEGPAAA
ncbi:hypothetical protein G4X40_04250 [Rhodococcus sp. D2-41]|uniref:Uncharacterized protein n=1 Tax=Speluncibacter jeojiensis TaxID=2710754 RepID=A0A9X4RG03_9ACTN|nr:hypothetical protein [Rhodococcus sp. D2-41]MDG3009356.1 hypothetical protein [Rhodococcus sp. D2-41]MDG3017089.1 hypothetical protein [Corynebacteriales bacterium D3-21]